MKTGEAQEIKALKKELQRKEKAMAEMAALLVLRKKVGCLLFGGRGRLTRALHRRKAIELIGEAKAAAPRTNGKTERFT